MTDPSPATPSEAEVPAKKSDDASAPGLVDSLKSLGEIAGVLTGIAFITGWLYWSTYYA